MSSRTRKECGKSILKVEVILSSASRIIKTTALILLIGILIQVLYDPISVAKHALNVSRVQDQFPKERAKWEAHGIKDYTFEIQGNGRSICQPSAIIEVKNDQVIKVETKDFSKKDSTPQLLPPEKWADPGWGDEVFLCDYYHFTITKIFDLLDSTLQDFPSSITQADFDPEYGFLRDFNFGIYVGYGLLRPQISDCCNIFSIKKFQPLNN
jgi:Family of unknown function (DUF6174)